MMVLEIIGTLVGCLLVFWVVMLTLTCMGLARQVEALHEEILHLDD